jgi:hypothetical protein
MADVTLSRGGQPGRRLVSSDLLFASLFAVLLRHRQLLKIRARAHAEWEPRHVWTRPLSSSPSFPTNPLPAAGPRCSRRGADIRLHPVHLDELEWQMKVAMIILNPTFLVFVQLVAPGFNFSQKPLICPIDQQVGPP